MAATTVIQAIARALQARQNCAERARVQDAPLSDWFVRHTARAERIARECLPSGGGIDCGTTLDLQASTPERIVFNVAFHHMDAHGSYDGWTEHQIIVRPSLVYGIDLRVTGRNRNEIKDYLAETYQSALQEAYDGSADTEAE